MSLGAYWDSLSKVRNNLPHLAIPINREEAEDLSLSGFLRAAYATLENIAATHLLGNMDGCQFEWVPEQDSAL